MGDILVKMKVFIDVKGFCLIVNSLNNSITYEMGKFHPASLKKTRKYPYEVLVPIEVVGQFLSGDMTNIDLYTLQRKNNGL